MIIHDYLWYILRGIYHVYTTFIQCICLVYILYILSVLLDSHPDPSSFTTAKSMTAAAAREKGVIPEADEETLLHQAWNPSQTNLRSVVYTMYILYISIVYTWYIRSICNVFTSEFNLLLLCCWQWPAATTKAPCLARHMLGDSWE